MSGTDSGLRAVGSASPALHDPSGNAPAELARSQCRRSAWRRHRLVKGVRIAQLIAVSNHAENAEPARSDKRPTDKLLPARQVQRQRRTRIGVEELAKKFAYAAEPDRQSGSLHAFLVTSVGMIAQLGVGSNKFTRLVLIIDTPILRYTRE